MFEFIQLVNLMPLCGRRHAMCCMCSLYLHATIRIRARISSYIINKQSCVPFGCCSPFLEYHCLLSSAIAHIHPTRFVCVFARQDSINFIHTYMLYIDMQQRFHIIEHIYVYMCRWCVVCICAFRLCVCVSVLVGVGSGSKRTHVLVPLE